MQTFEAMKSAVGVDIPQMLKAISTGGLVGRDRDEKAPSVSPVEA